MFQITDTAKQVVWVVKGACTQDALQIEEMFTKIFKSTFTKYDYQYECRTFQKYARVQEMKCTYNVILRSVRANIGEFRNFQKPLKSGANAYMWGNFVVHWKISLTINIELCT